MPQTLTDIRSLLASHGLRPKKRFGQNFLHDQNHMQRIVDAAALQAGELVLEVGPGTGALSERLLAAQVRLVACEVDRDLEPILLAVFEPYGSQVTLVVDDVMAGKRAINPQVLQALRPQGTPEPFKLVANLPYNVASPLLATLALDHPEMTLGVVMVQREVADRLVAPPGGKDYGALGILIQAMCEVTRVSMLSPQCFWPPPEIESSVVRLTRRDQPLPANPHTFAGFVQRLFTRRRKQLGSILGRSRPFPEGIEPSQRPEALSVEQLVRLAAWSVDDDSVST